MKRLLGALVAGAPVEPGEIEEAFGRIMDGDASAAEIGSLLTALAIRGETVEQLTAAVRAVRARATEVSVSGTLVDTCGTGGDGRGTFNVSTATALVAAGAGARVAKHGNRAASGKVGAADVLEALGVALDVAPERQAAAIEEFGFAFLFAPAHHPAMRHVGPVRRELGFRTIFNLVGPLANPAGATRQLLGLFDAAWIDPVAQTLAGLGVERAWVVHGRDGSDELTLCDVSDVARVDGGVIERDVVDPRDYGLELCEPSALAGGEDAAGAAEIVVEAIGGAAGPRSDIVALNAGAALVVAGLADDLADGIESARGSMTSGAAKRALDGYVKFTQANS